MKAFIVSQIRNALGRLKGTIVFIIKAMFISLVNVAFWLLPMFLLGYFAVKPLITDWRRATVAPITSQPHHLPTETSANYVEAKRFDLESLLRSVRRLLRELRGFKR